MIWNYWPSYGLWNISKYYLYCSHFTLQTDHQALLSALKNSGGKKTCQSRLTRWVYRLLPFHFKINNIACHDMGFAEYLSRNSNSPPTDANIDKNHVLDTIQTPTLHTAHRKLTNQQARKTDTRNDVKFNSDPSEQNSKQTITKSFSHSNSNSNYSLDYLYGEKLHITTTSRLHI